MEAIIYLLQVSACSAIFYLFYFFLLRRLTFFTINRWYLLGTLILSFLIPALHLPVTTQQHVAVIQPIVDFNQFQHFTKVTSGTIVQQASVVADSLTAKDIVTYMYWFIAAISIIKLALTLMMFINRSKGEQLFKVDDIRVVKAASNSSLFNVVFINDEGLSAIEVQQIIAHELLHIKLRHSADRFLARVALALLWFNPFAYFYIRSMEENHEFEVDRIATGGADKSEYAALLFKLSVAGNDYLMHSFSKVPLKNRIAMLFNKPTSNMKKIIYAFMLPVVAVSCLAFANLKTIDTRQDNVFYTKTEFTDKKGVELIRRSVHIPDSKGAMGSEDLKGTSVVFIVNGKLYEEKDVKLVEEAVKSIKLSSWSAGSTKNYQGAKEKGLEKYDTFFEFKGFSNPLNILADTVKTGYKQKIKRSPEQREAEERSKAEYQAYRGSAESKQKQAAAQRVARKLMTYRVVGILDTASTSMKLQGYKLMQGNDEFVLQYYRDAKSNLKGLFKEGDELQINATGARWTKGVPVIIEASQIVKGNKVVYEAPAPGPKPAFLYEVNKVRFAYGQVTDIKRYANGKWKSAIVRVDDYKIKFNVKPDAPYFKNIEDGDNVTFRFVHEMKTGEKEYMVNDWVALSNQQTDYGVKNPDFFYKFYEKI